MDDPTLDRLLTQLASTQADLVTRLQERTVALETALARTATQHLQQTQALEALRQRVDALEAELAMQARHR